MEAASTQRPLSNMTECSPGASVRGVGASGGLVTKRIMFITMIGMASIRNLADVGLLTPHSQIARDAMAYE
jgi:hypothetical protein